MEFDFETEARERERVTEKVIAAYEQLFRQAEAQLVLADLIEFAHVFAPTYREGRADRTAFEEGMRRVALRILRFSGWEKKLKDSLKGGLL